jgi:hypothetical protein
MPKPPARKGGRRVDLHTHTTFSDGLLTPEQLVERAVEKGLAALAITDHDSVEGLSRARAAAAGRLEIVSGIELSSIMDGVDLHILGYFVDADHEPLRARLQRFRQERRERIRLIVARLADLGIRLDAEAVLAAGEPGVVGRPHVAAAMVRAGAVGNPDEAFRRYLGANGDAFVPRPVFRSDEAIGLIHSANGVSVLAHPGASLADATIERLVAAGLRGLEVWHPQHPPSVRQRYRALAARLDVMVTGGSDFHGQPQGTDLGGVPVPYAALTRLKQAAGVAG